MCEQTQKCQRIPKQPGNVRASWSCQRLPVRPGIKLVFPDAAANLNLTLLQNEGLPVSAIPNTYNFDAYDRAILDPLGLEDVNHPKKVSSCNTCLKDLVRGMMPRFALANWLYYARDQLPADVRKGFEDMSVFEKALICRVRTSSILCRFRGFEEDDSGEIFAARRRHIKGNIISTPLDTVRMNDVLPPNAQSIADTMCALLISRVLPTQDTIHRLHPILVRKSRIKLLINFLVENNPHYKLSESFRGFSSTHLEKLFKGTGDVGIPSAIKLGHLPVNDAIESVTSDYSGRLDEVEGLLMENISYTLGDRSAFSYRQMTLHALEHCKEGRPFLSSQAGTQPVPDINNPNWLSWAHPNADPYGIGGFHHPRRKRPISMEQQLRHLLAVRDPFFENDPQIAFDVYNIIRKGSVNTSLRFCVPYTAYANIIRDIVHMDRDKLSELRETFQRDPTYQPKTDDERNIIRTMTSISPVAKKIPGSVAQKIKMRNEIRAMISQKGSPSLFVTLNPADYYNPIVTVLAARCSSEEDIDALEGWTNKQRTTAALKHPVACAQFFDFVMRKFIRVILRHGRKGSKGGIFGDCEAYYGTVETQGQGSLHCHMLIWLRGHLPPETLAESLKSSEQYRVKLANWLDSIMASGFQGSRSCFNDLSTHPREDIGMMEQHPTTIPGPQLERSEALHFTREMNEYLDEILLRFNWHVHTGTCWKYLRPRDKRNDENCRFGLDGTTTPATTIDPDTGTIQLRRMHPRMTHFNPTITFLLKCNTDVKFIGSGEDAKAFMYYVTDYITKPPLSMHAGLTALSYAIRQGDARGVLSENGRGESDNRRAMTIAVNSMLGHQEVSHPQVMSYIMGTGENYTSESFHPVNWSEIIRYVEKVLQTEQTTEGTDPPIAGVSMSVTMERGKINASNQLLDYIYRAATQPFESMGLYNFLASTRKVPKSPGSVSVPTNVGDFTSHEHHQSRTHSMRIRTQLVIPVLLGPRIPRRNGSDAERERWARDMCILFKPWRCPTELALGGSDWCRTLQHLMPFLTEADRRTVDNMSLMAEAKQARDARPRRTKNPFTSNKDQMNINTDIEAAMQDETPEAEQSIFAVLRADDNNTHPDREAIAVELPGRLKRLIGDEAACAFGDYLNTHDSLTMDIDDTDDPVSLSNPLDNDALIEQATFMRQCKHRGSTAPDDEDPSNDTSIPRVPAPPVPEEIPPSAAIQTLRDKFWNTKQRKKDMWRSVKELMKVRNIVTNPEQRRAFEIVAHHIIEGGTQLMMYIGGRGGTGKSYLIETIVSLFYILDRAEELRIGAPTGIAAALIGGNTLHSLLSVGANHRASDKEKTIRRLANEWRGVKYFIVDETSMVGAGFMAMMSAKLKMAKGDAIEESTKIFGGINLIFLGDFYQLSPPKQPSLFTYRLVRNPTFLQTRDNSGVDAIAGAYLWRSVNTVVLLKKNKRQKDDPILAKLLDMVRTDSCLDEQKRPINVEGTNSSVIDLLRSREINNVAMKDPTALVEFEGAPVIVGSRVIRDALNASLLVAHARRSGKSVHLYHSRDFVHQKKTEGGLTERLWNLPSHIAGEAFGQLPIFVGMRVMVTENVSVPFKVVNGKEGTVKHIVYTSDEAGRRFAEVVHVSIPGCTLKAPGLRRGVVPLFPTGSSIDYVVRSGEAFAKSFQRKQIPLVPAYSYTDYKSQGRTLTHAIIDLSSSKGQGVYVMLSRVTKLSGLLILRWFPDNRVLQRMSEELRDELTRLEDLDEETKKLYVSRALAPSPLRRDR